MKSLPWTFIIALVAVSLCVALRLPAAKADQQTYSIDERLTALEVVVMEAVPEAMGRLFHSHEVRIQELEKKLENCRCGAAQTDTTPKAKVLAPRPRRLVSSDSDECG